MRNYLNAVTILDYLGIEAEEFQSTGLFLLWFKDPKTKRQIEGWERHNMRNVRYVPVEVGEKTVQWTVASKGVAFIMNEKGLFIHRDMAKLFESWFKDNSHQLDS